MCAFKRRYTCVDSRILEYPISYVLSEVADNMICAREGSPGRCPVFR